MKTLICIPCLLTGGTEIQTLNTVHALVQGGHEVTVACYFEHTPYMVERYRKAGAEVQLFSPEGTRVGGYRAIPYLYKHLRRAIKAVRPDVTHVQYMAPGAMVILLLWLLGVRNIIATAHTAADIYKDLRLIHFLQRHILRAFTCITERAERSFFGSSQLYTTETVLGKRNHFTIYNALPAQMRCNVDANVDVDCLRDEDTRGVYENANENNSQFTIDNSQLTISSGAASLNTQPSSIDLNLSCQRDNTEFRHDDACFACVGQDSQRLNVDENLFQDVSDTTTQKKNSAMSAAPSLRGQTRKASVATTAGLSAPRSLACELSGGEASVLGVVSRLEPIKGMDLVVPAFAEVLKRFPEVQLLVVGDGSLRATMEQQAAELGCADSITWVGRQPQEELAQWYGQMDIVLMPSRSEGFGLTAIEAMANGCVVVASEVGGLPEVVRDGECGLLHRCEDVQDMVAKVCTLLGDNKLYERLRSQSLYEVEKYSFERYALIVNDLYDKLF